MHLMAGKDAYIQIAIALGAEAVLQTNEFHTEGISVYYRVAIVVGGSR